MSGTRTSRLGRIVATLAIAAVAATSWGASSASAATDRADTLAAARAAGTVAQDVWLSETLTSGDVDWFRFDATGTGRLMTTLGGLPADYSLALYDSQGTKLTTSARSGVTFERVAKYVTAGSYYVKVWSPTKAHSAKPYRLKFRVPATGVTVLSSYVEYSTVKGKPVADWIAEVYNNTASWQQVNGWHVTYYDRNGADLGSGTDTSLGAYPRPVARGAVLAVHSGGASTAGSESVPAGTARIAITVDATPLAAAPALEYSFKVVSAKTVKKGKTYAVRITNRGPRVPLLVVVSGYTAYGNIAGVVETGGRVAANTSEIWTFTLPGTQPNYTRLGLVSGT